MYQATSLRDIASQISLHCNRIADYLEEQHFPQPSFNSNVNLTLPTELDESRIVLAASGQLLSDLITTPEEQLFSLIPLAMNDIAAFLCIYHFKLNENIPLGGSTTYDDIAKSAGISEPKVRAVLRHAMTRHFLRETKEGHVEHTAMSEQFTKNSGIRDWIGHFSISGVSQLAVLTETWDKYGTSEDSTKSVVNVALKTDVNPITHTVKDPVMGPRFMNALSWVSKSPRFDNGPIVDCYPWEGLGSSLVVDVGGGNGNFSVSLAKKFPNLKFLVQDVEEAGRLQNVPADLKDRISFSSHDFFTDQPVSASTYMLKMVMHDWPDKSAADILRRLVKSLQPGGRILLVDMVFAPPGQLPLPVERLMTASNLGSNMHNGQDRTIEDYERLVKMADPRLKIIRVKHAVKSRYSVIEITIG
ncbi:S-adenosyl-L-methionine-dependent methyltransferase [Xylogone sp. PMI_703]|nr:S-adenosyl-L-methionine-dependent methyltransferase [Xylogone sp. PMI_703]